MKNALFRSLAMAALAVATLATATFADTGSARAETRTLDIYFTHTKERKKITFKKNGKYVKSGLRKLNRILRDHRRKEATKMDPKLFDLVWEIYKEAGGKKPIHVISGYRSPRTNAMLRRRGRGNARKSQHMRGTALDWKVPGVSVAKLHAIAMRLHGGGVGHYRNSFIHTDTARVRHWPRMSKRQLSRIFPKGRTIHVPSNGKPLRGYKVALANLKKGRRADGRRPRYKSDGDSKTLLARLFRKDDGNDSQEDDEDVAAAKKTLPTPAVKPAAPGKVEAEQAETVVAAETKGNDLFAADAKKALEAAPAKLAPTVVARSFVPTIRPSAPVGGAPERAIQPAAVPTLVAAIDPARPARRPGAGLSGTEQALASFSFDEVKRRREQSGSQAIAYAVAETQTPGLAAADALAAGRPAVTAPVARTGTELAMIEPATAPQRSIADLKQRVGASFAKPRAPVADRLAAIQPAPLRRPEAPKIDSPIITASLAPNDRPARSVRTLAEQVRQGLAKRGSAKRATFKRERTGDVTFVRLSRGAAPVPFVIGNLYGRTVKSWATARTTRRGMFATLHAPNYKRSTVLPAPDAVYAVGFRKQSRQRTDAFTGTSMLKVSYQELASLR